MAINVYLSGTTGAADGTLDVQGDGIGLSLTALNSVEVAHLRAPSGDVNADAIVATAPTDCHASTDGVTYGTTATYSAGEVGDTNTPLYIKRVADSGNTTPLALTVAITGLANTELAPAAPVLGTVTVSAVTASTATVTFSATDANADPLTYKVAVTTSPTPPADWSGYSNVTSPLSVSGLTGETAFYAHVLASDGSLTDVATSAQFTTSAADPTAPVIAGTLTATPGVGQVTLAGPTATDNVGIAKWQYQVDGGAWVDVASTSGTFPSTIVSGLAIGSRSFAVRALDPSSNPSTTKTASATVADITAPTISGTLTATAGDAQVTLSGPTATDNVGIAKWQYQVDGGAWVDVASTDAAFPSTVVSGLTNGIAYTFGVRSVDTATNASSVRTANATPSDTYIQPFTDDFTTLDSSRWQLSTSGSGTAAVSGGVLTLNTLSGPDAAIAALKKNVDLSAVRTYKAQARQTNGKIEPFRVISIVSQPTIPTGGVDFDTEINRARFVVTFDGRGSVWFYGIMYIDSAGVRQYWTESKWSTTPTSQSLGTITAGAYLSVSVETNGTQIRALIKNAAETITYTTTSWVPLASIKSSTDPLWLMCGEPLTEAWISGGDFTSFTVS